MIPSHGDSFSIALTAFVLYEFIVGMYSPCEGMIRAKYIPAECRGSVMVIPTIVVNVSVAVAVISTEAVTKQTSLAFVLVLLAIAGFLQLSLLPCDGSCIIEWARSFRALTGRQIDVPYSFIGDHAHPKALIAQTEASFRETKKDT